MSPLTTLALAGLLASPAIAGGLNVDLPPGDIFDYVIVGGGPAGLTVGSRLAEDSSVTVLVLEAGVHDNYEADVMIPLNQGNAGRRGGNCGGLNWCDYTVPQTYLDGKTRLIPQGKGLGGGTLINGMLNNRGDPADYAIWSSLNNDQSWSYNSLLPYFQRAEHFYPESSAKQQAGFGIGEDASQHGFNGPQSSAFPTWKYQASKFFFAAMRGLGIPTVTDPVAPLQKGAMYLPQSIDNQNQSRADARRARWDPNSNKANFYVSTHQTVQRVLFQGGCATPGANGLRAVGVISSGGKGQRTWTAVARREVILAAGALRTPQLLELSGIGPAVILNKIGVATRVRLPGVGNNLQDHTLTTLSQAFTNQSIVYPNILNNQGVYQNQQNLYYSAARPRRGLFTFGPPDGNAFLSLPQISTRAAALQSQAAGQSRGQYLVSGLDNTVIDGYEAQKKLLIPAVNNNGRAIIEYLQNDAGLVQMTNQRPFTRGTVHASNNDVFTPPTLDFRYGSNPIDFAVMHDAVSFNNKLFHTPQLRQLQPAFNDPPENPSDAQITEFLKRTLATEYHPSGTAAMLPQNLGGVVSTQLLVYGTQNLRVVDASIFPIIPAAHLQSVVYGVAERAAQIIKDANTAAVQPKLPLDQSVCRPPASQRVKRALERVAESAGGAGNSFRKWRRGEIGKRQGGYTGPSEVQAGFSTVGYPDFNSEKCKGWDVSAGDLPASVGQPVGQALKVAEALLQGGQDVLGQLLGDASGPYGNLTVSL